MARILQRECEMNLLLHKYFMVVRGTSITHKEREIVGYVSK